MRMSITSLDGFCANQDIRLTTPHETWHGTQQSPQEPPGSEAIGSLADAEQTPEQQGIPGLTGVSVVT